MNHFPILPGETAPMDVDLSSKRIKSLEEENERRVALERRQLEAAQEPTDEQRNKRERDIQDRRGLTPIEKELERRQLEVAQEPIDESPEKNGPLREGEKVSGQEEFEAEMGEIYSEHLVHCKFAKHLAAEKPDCIPDQEPTDEQLKGQEYIEEVARRACARHPDWIDNSIVEPSAEKPDCIPDQEPNLIISDGQGNSLGFNVDLPLSFEAYQAGAKKTAIYNQDARVMYPALGLAGEVGELGEKVLQMAVHAGKCANQVKKIIRDDDCECDTPRKHAIGKEIGGVLWYCAAVASDLGLSLADIAQENLDILSDRQERGTIKGDGDER